jgi:16S rRNA (guanine527-N7)-methyltransferase
MGVASLRAIDQSLESAAASLGLSISNEQADRLALYCGLLQRWNAVYNLTSLKDVDQIFTRHLLDCLAVVTPLRRKLGPIDPVRLLDAGSGAGLPGLVIAIMEPRIGVVCIDSVGKKVAFLQQAVVELGLRNISPQHARVEQYDGRDFDVVTSRAFASLSDFVRLTQSALAPSGVWMAMKAKTPVGEISAVSELVSVFHVEQIQIPRFPADRCIVWMRPL